MSILSFKKSKFLSSFVQPKKVLKLPRIVIVGTSNVGKSSLINHLCQNKKLARISSFPGKTQTINYFEIDEKFLLIDLPGYGFSKTSKQKKQDWKNEIETFFEKEKDQISLLLLLIDSRRTFSQKDRLMYSWAKYYKVPVLCVLTKIDKFNKTTLNKNMHKVIDSLPEETVYVAYSTKNLKFRRNLIEAIKKNMKGKF